MTKLLVLYYSMYGHVETMTQAIAEGARGNRARRNSLKPGSKASTSRRSLRS